MLESTSDHPTTLTCEGRPFNLGLPVAPSTFLQVIVPALQPGWFIEIRAKRPDSSVHQVFNDTAEAATVTGLAQAPYADIWFGVGPRLRRRGTKGDVGALGAVWADVDFKHFPDGIEGATRALTTFPLPPSVVIASGAGFQPYWLLIESARPNSFVRIEAINRGLMVALAPEGSRLDAVGDVARVLRLPATFNFKYSPARPVRVVHWQPEARYAMAQIEAVLPVMSSPFSHSPSPTDEFGAILEGERNSHLTSLAGSMRRRGMSQEEIAAALLVVNAHRCQPSLDDREVLGIAASVARYAPVPFPTALERRARARAKTMR